MIIKTFERREKKCVIKKALVPILINTFSENMLLDDYCAKKGSYTVTNIYYDTADHAIARESLSKPYYKEKMRMRCYTLPENDNDTVFLEIKKKVGGIGSKRRVDLGYKEAQDFIRSHSIPEGRDTLDNQILNEMKYYLENNPVLPSVLLTYSRIAMKGRDDPTLRVTFDFDVFSRRNELDFSHGLIGERLISEASALMEVKFNGAVPLWLARIMSDNNIAITGFSKFSSEYVNDCQSDCDRMAK